MSKNCPLACFGIVAAGKIDNYSALKKALSAFDFVVACDGGLAHLAKIQFTPDLIVGDFDSLQEHHLAQYRQVKKKVYKREKNFPDLQGAIKACLKLGAKKITVWGAQEGRSDHLVSNLFLALEYPQTVFLESEKELIFAVKGTVVLPVQKGQMVSFIPLGAACKGVTTKGFQWELTHKTISARFFSLSNVAEIESPSLSIKKGSLLVIIEKATSTKH